MRTLLSLLALILMTTIADARCAMSDIAGTWRAYLFTTNNSRSFWYLCPVTISPQGVVTGDECSSSSGRTVVLKTPTVSLRKPTQCQFRISMNVDSVSNFIDANMTLEKSTLVGLGFSDDGPSMFQMVKQ